MSCGSGTSTGPTFGETNRSVGIYGNGMKEVPRPRRVRRSAYQVRRYAKAVGVLMIFAAAIAVISAAALTPSAGKSNGPALPAETNKDQHIMAAPTASFTWTQGAITNLSISFDGSGSTDDGTIVSWDWNFGDGGTGTGVTTWHTYATPGVWTVTLTVTDNEALTNSASQLVTVQQPGIPPPPYTIFGYVTDGSATPVLGATAVVTDLRTGAVWTYTDSDNLGFYNVDLNFNASGWAPGDTVNVTVTLGGLIGWGEAVAVGGDPPFTEIDIVMNAAIPEFPTVILPVLGMVALVAVIGVGRRRVKQ